MQSTLFRTVCSKTNFNIIHLHLPSGRFRSGFPIELFKRISQIMRAAFHAHLIFNLCSVNVASSSDYGRIW
jgi:hypothetical protein